MIWPAHLTMAVVLAAGLGKIADCSAFAAELRRWSIIPLGAVPATALVVPLIEFGVGVAWFLRMHRRLIAMLTAGLLAAFSVAYVRQAAIAVPPNCTCFGAWEQHRALRAASRHVVARNALLIAGLFPVLAIRSPGRSVPVPAGAIRARAASPAWRARGATLPELLLGVLLLAVLVTLAVPHLSQARRAARGAVSLSNLRMHGAIFQIYALDSQDRLPCYTDREKEWSVIRAEALGVERTLKYFWGSQNWNLALADEYYDGDPYLSVFFPPTYPYGQALTPGEQRGPTPYQYSCSFLAGPEFWNPETRSGPAQWRFTRLSEVAFPDAKCLLTNTYIAPRSPDPMVGAPGPTSSTTWEVALIDGSALRLPHHRIEAGYPTGDGRWMAPIHPGAGEPGTHTLGGVRGRDRR